MTLLPWGKSSVKTHLIAEGCVSKVATGSRFHAVVRREGACGAALHFALAWGSR